MDFRFTHCQFRRWSGISINLFHFVRHICVRRRDQFFFEKTEMDKEPTNGCFLCGYLDNLKRLGSELALALLFQGVREGVFGFMIAVAGVHIHIK